MADTMTVTVRDRASEAPWGSGLTSPKIRKITIAATCPKCGGPRGEPRGLNQHNDGVSYWVQVWDNPCGHVDGYAAVVAEADARAAAEPKENTVTQLIRSIVEYPGGTDTEYYPLPDTWTEMTAEQRDAYCVEIAVTHQNNIAPCGAGPVDLDHAELTRIRRDGLIIEEEPSA